MDENPNEFLIGYRPSMRSNSKKRPNPNQKQQKHKGGELRKQINKVVGTDTDNL